MRLGVFERKNPTDSCSHQVSVFATLLQSSCQQLNNLTLIVLLLVMSVERPCLALCWLFLYSLN